MKYSVFYIYFFLFHFFICFSFHEREKFVLLLSKIRNNFQPTIILSLFVFWFICICFVRKKNLIKILQNKNTQTKHQKNTTKINWNVRWGQSYTQQKMSTWNWAQTLTKIYSMMRAHHQLSAIFRQSRHHSWARPLTSHRLQHLSTARRNRAKKRAISLATGSALHQHRQFRSRIHRHPLMLSRVLQSQLPKARRIIPMEHKTKSHHHHRKVRN